MSKILAHSPLRRLRNLTLRFAKLLSNYDPLLASRAYPQLLACRHPVIEDGEDPSLCFSRYCGPCNRFQAEAESKLLTQTLHILARASKNPKMYLFTATAPDCKPTEIRKTLTALKAGWTVFVKRPPIASQCQGWFLTYEIVTSGQDSALENVHLHAAFLMKASYSGRYYLSAKRWDEEWRKSVDTAFYRSMDIQKIKDAGRLASYVCKYNPKHFIKAMRQDVGRILTRFQQTASLKRYSWGGELRTFNQWQRPEDLTLEQLMTGLHTLHTAASWRKALRRLARKDPYLQAVEVIEKQP